MAPVDVVVPVYEGFEEVRDCIESLLAARQRTEFHCLVINDASPNPRIRDYIEELAGAGRIALLTNEVNLGFIRTANRGMQHSDGRDIVLLNSDTVVSNDWLDRLQACAAADSRIGTVTPFSNNAEICSFPRLCRINTLPLECTPADFDAVLARGLAGQYIDIPTAVGFCMYIKRDCLDGTGYFDAETFGLGYGEENDFCMRARERGWRNPSPSARSGWPRCWESWMPRSFPAPEWRSATWARRESPRQWPARPAPSASAANTD